MAKRDCSELDVLINEMSLNLASTGRASDVKGVVKILENGIPTISVEGVAESIVLANKRGAVKEASDTAKRIAQMKEEARSINADVGKIVELEEHLKSGTLPMSAKKAKAFATETQKKMRAVVKELRKQIRGSDPARIERVQKQIDFLNAKITTGIRLPEPRVIARGSDELEELRFQASKLKAEINARIQDLKPRSIFEKVVVDPFNLARALMAGTDLSGLRQGGFIAMGNPLKAIKAQKQMFQALSSKSAQRIQREILEESVNSINYKRSGLHLGDLDGALSSAEEIFQSDLVGKIARSGKIGELATAPTRASQRAFTVFLNKLRADSFDAMYRSMAKNGTPTQGEMEFIANFINVATGRGNLRQLEAAAKGLSTAFFAPKYVVSRFQLISGSPLFKRGGGSIFKRNSARQLVAIEYAKSLSGLAAMYGLVHLSAATIFKDEDISVELDPRSSDFGKIKIGNTRIDPLFGIAQTATLLARTLPIPQIKDGKVGLFGLKTKSIKSGKVKSLRRVGFGETGFSDVLLNKFLRTKFAPLLAAPIDLAAGENVVGQTTSLTGRDTEESILLNLVTPMAFRDIVDTMKEQGIPRGTAIGVVAMFGLGVQNFDANRRRKGKRPER